MRRVDLIMNVFIIDSTIIVFIYINIAYAEQLIYQFFKSIINDFICITTNDSSLFLLNDTSFSFKRVDLK